MAPRNNKFEYFFDLPPELRELILSHICVFPAGILVGGGAHGRLRRPPTNLFLASPILYREAGDLYYARNTFHLSFLAPSSSGRKRTRHRHQHQHQHTTTSDRATAALMRLLTHPDTAGARRRVRSAVVAVRRIGAQLQDVVVPALEGMVLHGVLRHVRVDVVGGPPPLRNRAVAAGRGPGWMARDDLDGNPALRALLVLLADPGLEGARLRVLGVRHAWFWCRFHEQPPRGGEAGPPPPPGAACAMLGGGSESLPLSVSLSLPPSATAAAGGGAAARERGEGGWGDGFLEVDIGRLVNVVCAGDAAEFNIKVV
ncbi:hypothetical protein B0I37DRAFT_409742 [Chaetomium sp. MPI-CAGE-AT-0009]|nr:hypothetical protein B0I37DRAFT_409742 [Chaetomium sp. MPI-CAGE-AT-0009]